MTDARYADGEETPLRLQALGADDLAVISALLQDAVLPVTEMRLDRRRFVLLVNRFRWEDRDRARAAGRPFERVRSLLVVAGVLKAASHGIDRHDRARVLSVLALGFRPGEDGAGRLVLTFAGDGAVALDVECLDVTLRDVTRPYRAHAADAPRHPDAE
ncbi:MAG: DUF2948 family protein [Rhodobacteraceae bacterium]|nr:DUF2948 family protein [Paracoccaceae bacterium]